jgi:hypothetical protein
MSKDEMIEIYMNFSKYIIGEIAFPNEEVLKQKTFETSENLGTAKLSVLRKYNRQNLLPKKMVSKYSGALSQRSVA